ncbi:uncharacterized protein LOC118174102 isoform X2 [Oxyura jamaicensis]|uniref:uncharacterized protein LOC118174102 isoform X2 n=1 Tax=Oxyura jamaicensis TaxID=8884 RepID=UPI0015A68481|nr:uncharacterized protein LOC118174102 isoform X2 [Oxyura jamaicensis]
MCRSEAVTFKTTDLHCKREQKDFPFPEPAVTFVKFRYSPDQAIMEKCVFPILIISDEKTTEIPGILEESFCQHSLLSVQLFSVLYQSFLKKLSCTESSTLPRKTQPIPQHRFLEEEPGEGCLRRYRGTQKQQGAARKTRGDKAGRLHTVTRGLLQQHAGWEGETALQTDALKDSVTTTGRIKGIKEKSGGMGQVDLRARSVGETKGNPLPAVLTKLTKHKRRTPCICLWFLPRVVLNGAI